MNSNRSLFTMIVAATMFSNGVFSGPVVSVPSLRPANSNSSQAAAVDQLASNLTLASDSIASGNTTAMTAQLTAIIGELSVS